MKNNIIKLIVIGALLITHPITFYAQNFVHPGGLVTQNDIDRIKYLLNTEGDLTIKAAFEKLKTNGHASYNYSANATTYIKRGGGSGENYSVAMNQVAAAFQNALMWRITDDSRYGDCAVRILNAWARTCKSIEGDTNASLASGIYGYEFAQAGELLRGYSGWADADFKAYQDWMRHLWYPRAMYFIVNRHGRTCATNEGGAYFSNWGLCNALAIMSIGILCDDVAIYNQGLSFYKDDKCDNFTDAPRNPIKDIGNNEFLGNLVVWLHPDSRGPFGYLGQMQESGRDQGHATMAAGLAADICQTAWNQGDDLYAYMNNRIAAGFEYIALVNSLASSEIVIDSVPFIPYERWGLPTENYTSTQNGLGGWGATRPYWDRVVAHYEGEKGITMRYSRKMKEKTGIDGGGGHYGGNSGGFDHLGFSTLTNYRPTTMYPIKEHCPITLGTTITYKGSTIDDNRISGVDKGSVLTLTPSLPNNVVEDGTWKWQTGETTRELTLTAQHSGIYRVTYTSANGTKSTQAFNIAVWGDCTPDIVTPKITVGDTSHQDTIISILPYQKFSLSISTIMYGRGTAVWSTGGTGFSLTLSNGIRNDSVFWVDHFNEGGYKTRITFHVKLTYITPSISINGGNAESTNKIAVEAGQNVEFRPKTTTGYDGGTFRWSTGHISKNLMVLNVQKAKSLQVYYTLTKNGITTTDTLDFSVSVKRNNYQLSDGDYYIQNAENLTYFTNPNATAITKEKPTFMVKSEADTISQIWTITKETNTLASGRFKIVSKKDGNYVNENSDFGVNSYYPEWNTYTFYCLDGEDLFAIQNGGKSGNMFWVIDNNIVTGKGSSTQNGYPFLISPIIAQEKDTTNVPGESVISYIAPAYSVNGGASQYGNIINIEPGKNLKLKPITVNGLAKEGTWLWQDNSTSNFLDLGIVQNGGIYSVLFTYSENEKTYLFPLTYTVALSEDNYVLSSGDYRILRASDNYYLTNDGTLNPVFATTSSDLSSQIWTITQDETSLRHKIVSSKDGRFVEEHGRFNNSTYDPAWNTYLLHYLDQGEKRFAIQNAGSAGNTYWAIEGDMINDRNHTTREGYPFTLEVVNTPPAGIEGDASSASATFYPNPVQDHLMINIPESTDKDIKFVLYGIDGRIIKTESCKVGENKINTSDILKGLYIGILSIDKKSEIFKITKK